MTEAQDSRLRNRAEAFVEHLLHLRAASPAAHGALRRGDTPALADKALAYLARWQLEPSAQAAALLFASALCRHVHIAPDDSTPLGRAAFKTLSGADWHHPGETGAGRRVIAAQRQALPMAHRTFSGLLIAVADEPRTGLDWTGLWRTYRDWDEPDLVRRHATRQRLLLDFYGTAPRQHR